MNNESKVNIAATGDKGHDALMQDLYRIVDAAKNKTFHDFESQEAAPKMELKAYLTHMIEDLIQGKYDN